MARSYHPNRYGDRDPADDAVRALERAQWAREDQARPRTNGIPAPKAVGLSVREPTTYSRWKDGNGGGPSGSMFLRDVVTSYLFKDANAKRRLDQHQAEQLDGPHGRWLRAGAGTGNFSGLVVPFYAVSDYAYAAAAGRQFADACAHRDLPATG